MKTGETLLDPLFSDEEIAVFFSDAEQLRAMLRFEGALARVQGRIGVIPEASGEAIGKIAEDLELDPATLAEGTAAAGVPVLALVAALRQAVHAAAGQEAAQYVHWGATSQDVVDSGLVLRLRGVLAALELRIEALADRLAETADRHRLTLKVGHTRGQRAVPTSFGLEVAGWLMPLLVHRQRLGELYPRLLVVSLGGAAGTLSSLGVRGPEVCEALAAELKLGAPPLPWHTRRDAIAELAGWLSLVTGGLGKMGQDVLLMAQSEIGELREGGPERGRSSTMPHKANPVSSELLVTVARMNATLLSGVHQALLQEQQRGGSGWQLEWLTLPQMVVLTGAALRHAGTLLADLEVDAGRMASNLEACRGLVLAEAANFALAAHMPRDAALREVRHACEESIRSERHLIDVLAERLDTPVDWMKLRDPIRQLGSAEVFIDRVLEAVRRWNEPD